MGIITEKYLRKPLYVDAVRVTPANFDEMAEWCQGEIDTEEISGTGTAKKYIRVRVHNPKNPRQTKAYVGDWLLYTDRGYKVYTNKAFRTAFDLVVGEESNLGEIEVPEAELQQEKTPEETALYKGHEPLHGASTGADPEFEGVTEAPNPAAATEPISEQPPETAAAGKRVLSQEEQEQMGADEVRELVRSGEAILAQDLAAESA